MQLLSKILILGVGGAFGTLSRYYVSGMVHKFCGIGFPWGTLAVNLIGSFLIGLSWGIFENTTISSSIKLFLFIGIFGGFTTFSTYTYECLNLLKVGLYKTAFLNIIVSNILGILLVWAGFVLSKLFFHLLK